ncbi:PREDICTED: telomerase-binding protein EST1A-like [Priapulus caudatus]|uniref:Telomerase-binding protein EST1A-like n=1 Tax=Priapulus caudatus TaxID=37621 RepID=A0ABM1F376_PRICU|nr:PREDICTED: telomerase-binding protein EST1A-like [Priapulus caudatus]
METFGEVALLLLQELQVLAQHSPFPIRNDCLLQYITINIFTIDSSALKDCHDDREDAISVLQLQALSLAMCMFAVLVKRAAGLLEKHMLEAADPEDLLSDDLRHVLPSIKVWCDWLSSVPNTRLWTLPAVINSDLGARSLGRTEQNEYVLSSEEEEELQGEQSSAIQELKRKKQVLERRKLRHEQQGKQRTAVLEKEKQERLAEVIVCPYFLVPDTNCFIDHLAGLQRVVAARCYTLVVPLVDSPIQVRRDIVLLTEDRNLRLKAHAHNVPVSGVPALLRWANLR